MKRACILALITASACCAENVTYSLLTAVNAMIAATQTITPDAPGEVRAAVTVYLTITQTCMSQATAVLSGAPMTPVEQAAQIDGACALNSSVQLPRSTPAAIATSVNAVSYDLVLFLRAAHANANASIQPHAPVVVLSQKRLKLIRKKVNNLRQVVEHLPA